MSGVEIPRRDDLMNQEILLQEIPADLTYGSELSEELRFKNWNQKRNKHINIFVAQKKIDKLVLKDMVLFDEGSTVSGDGMYIGGTDCVPSTKESFGSLAEPFKVVNNSQF